MRREEDKNTRPSPGLSRRVELSISSPVGDRVGNFEFTNVVIYAEQDGEKILLDTGGVRWTGRVEADKKFDIVCEYDILNYASRGMLDFPWTTCLTVYNETKRMPVGSDRHQRVTSEEHGQDRVAFKINQNSSLRATLWAHQQLKTTPPPESSW